MALEQLVRPFQSPRALATRRIVISTPSDTTPPAPVVLQWGDVGTLPEASTEQDADPAQVGFKIENCSDAFNESGRNIEKIRVENPNDPSQFVMVERIKNISFDKIDSGGQLNNRSLVGAFVNAFTDFTGSVDSAFPPISRAERCQSKYTLKA